MKCLRCQDVELDIKVRGEGTDVVEIDLCPECGGIWLDAKELKKLDDNFFVDLEAITFDSVKPTEEDAGLSCPRCDGGPSLNKVSPAGSTDVVVDTCSTCGGFWLDKDELDKMKDVSDQVLVASLFADE